MRAEVEVLSQLINFAGSQEKVRAAVLNGSRVNPNAEKDIFCDYDVIFFVSSPDYYLNNQEWIKIFGELVIMQQNDFSTGGRAAYIFLMQFKDGVRIDLSFRPVECVDETVNSDTLTKVLLDKDNRIGLLPPPDDSGYYVLKPTEEEFGKVLNEAWWIQTYVAKGIWRDELSLARYMHDAIIQECIIKLLSWYVGIEYEWKANVGKCGKWLKKYLPKEIYAEFAETYPGTDYEAMWTALFNAGALIRKIGINVAQSLGYKYLLQEDTNVTEYIRKVKALEKDATEFR